MGSPRLDVLGKAVRGSRSLGIGVDPAKGLRRELMSSFREGRDQERGGVCIELCVLCFVVTRSASLASPCFQLPLPHYTPPSSLLSPPPPPPALGLGRIRTEGASGVEMLLAFGAAVRSLLCSAFGGASAAPDFPNPSES